MKYRNRLFFKFSLAFILVGLIPVFILSLLSLYQFTGQIERHTVNNIRQMMVYMSNNVHDIFAEYDEISRTMYTKTDASEIFGEASKSLPQDEVNLSAMDNFIKNMLFSDSHIQNVLFVRGEDEVLYQQSRGNKRLNPYETYPPVGWQYRMRDNPKELGVFAYHMEGYYNSQDLVMTFARNWIDTREGVQNPAKLYGTLYLDLDIDVFDNLLNQSRLGGSDEIYIVDRNDIILYSNRRDRIGGRFDEFSTKSRGDMMVFTEPIPYISGKVVGLISKEDIYSPILRTRNTIWLAAGLSLGAMLLLALLFSRRFTKPILLLMRQMLKVESGNLDTAVVLRQKDEMGRLANGFNRMVERLREFIDEAYVHEIKRKQAELNALKSQIRPHFLYNTLEVIRMSALVGGDRKVADMIHSLSDQLQYVIDYGDESVTLGQELEHLRHYFHLIEVRFYNQIVLGIETEDEILLQAKVLKLILQPLVENAVHHGIRPKGGKGMVLITIERLDPEILSITVYDNGIGIEQTKLEALQSSLEGQSDHNSRSIGMTNVHERIKAAFGESYGLDIESNPNIGTSVRLILPLRLEAEHEQAKDDIGR
ncbi:cache domain-containing sensor histidine kinase [Paenibacillus sanguinis]|uniref:cache domain-containing sensor histidine kinase n=1 Tax=Paenibacillus sanguinis TaxID=225906 RepID=UPI0003735B03|nr:sensor histidine kinase [Paenibacillus sanguinis]